MEEKEDTKIVAWRKKMYQLSPDPKIGDIVEVCNNNKLVCYQALTSEGYDTRWKKISEEQLERLDRITEDPPSYENYVYMSDGMYIHEDDAWW